MSTIYLIRHGQASFGQKNYDRLSSTGIDQSKILGSHFKQIGLKFNAVYHGTLERQRQTAKEALRACSKGNDCDLLPVTDKAFNEFDGQKIWDAHLPHLIERDPLAKADFERLSANPKVFQRLFERVVLLWTSGRYDKEGDLLWIDYKKEVISGAMNIIDRHGSGKRIAVFTSAGSIAVIIQKILDLSDTKTIDIFGQVKNASVTRIQYGAGKITLAGFNDTTHLETIGDSTLLTYR